ncbi:SusD family protein [mine drainage metagenome]|uniref:SusD family protein n=1 Tax=mine drainage metagenome TaxID=410659 RepID=A0A1J5SU38_9ZZZZ
MADNTFITTGNSGRYITLNNYAFNNADAYALGIWQNAYISIKYANNIISAAPTLPNTANVNQYLGEAYAIRALMHFELVRNFATAYAVDSTKPGVPIINAFNLDPYTVPTRAVVKDVYKQIISDLEQAYKLMTIYRGTAYFSKYAARALEARVYQNMGDWADAKTTALDAIANSGVTLLPSTTYAAYWANPVVQSASTKNETFFEVASDLTSNNGFDQIGFIYLTVGGGYGDILATPELAGLYSATDARKALCPVGTRSGQAGTVYLCQKYPNPANGTDKDDIKVLRLSDVLLIAAEAYYNLGDIPNANLYLNKVAQQRDPSFAGWADAGTQVLEDILIERRKELAFEGSRFWDLVRLNRSWTKVKNQNPLTTVAVAPGNIALMFPIPLNEINANPNITQNPGY